MSDEAKKILSRSLVHQIERLTAELAAEREHKVEAMAAVIRAVDMKIEAEAERDALREERLSTLIEIADALTTAIRKERWDIVIHVRDAVKDTGRV